MNYLNAGFVKVLHEILVSRKGIAGGLRRVASDAAQPAVGRGRIIRQSNLGNGRILYLA